MARPLLVPSAIRFGLTALGAALFYWMAVAQLSVAPRPRVETGTLVKLPLFVEVALAGGDRYLAANIGTVRAMVASIEPTANTEVGLSVIAAIQKDVSRLNPGHEDNYYFAAASLVGTPRHQDGQWILRRAIDARPFDFLPPFYYAVNRMHYDRQPVDGARWLRLAAARSDDQNNRAVLEQIAGRWLLKGDDPGMAASMLDAMAQQARTPGLRDYFGKRAQQARDLAVLQEALGRYEQRYRRRASRLDELVTGGVLARLPKDPFGNGYDMDGNGTPIVRFTVRSAGK